jgi:pilus assembly protein Flp/PilA
MLQVLKRLVREEEGQGMAEYGLILALIAVVVIGALGLIGTDLQTKFGEISAALQNAGSEGEN